MNTGVATPIRNPTIYDLYKKSQGSNLPNDLISGSSWISPITKRKVNLKDVKTPMYMKPEQYKFIFSEPTKKTAADRIAEAHFRESDRREYIDFIQSSPTYFINNAPTPQPEKKPFVITPVPVAKRAYRKRTPPRPDSGIAMSPF